MADTDLTGSLVSWQRRDAGPLASRGYRPPDRFAFAVYLITGLVLLSQIVAITLVAGL